MKEGTGERSPPSPRARALDRLIYSRLPSVDRRSRTAPFPLGEESLTGRSRNSVRFTGQIEGETTSRDVYGPEGCEAALALTVYSIAQKFSVPGDSHVSLILLMLDSLVFNNLCLVLRLRWNKLVISVPIIIASRDIQQKAGDHTRASWVSRVARRYGGKLYTDEEATVFVDVF